MNVIFRMYIYTHTEFDTERKNQKKNQIAPRTGGGPIRPTRRAAVQQRSIGMPGHRPGRGI